MLPPPPPGALARIVEHTLALLAIPSVTRDEALICDWTLEQGRALMPHARAIRTQNSVLFVPELRPELPTIALFGHLDTVSPASDQPQGQHGDRIYGCGASDMKGALAVMLELMLESQAFTRANPVFVFYDKEEGPMAHNGLIPVLEAGLLPPIDLALCLEPTDNRVQPGCVGSLHALVTVRGRRAHSARPWQGDSAIVRAAPVLARVAAFADRPVQVSGLTFVEVMNVTQLNTFNNRNVIPDRVVLDVNFRFAPGRSIEQAVEELKTLLLGPDPAREVPEGLQVEIVDESPSGAVCLDQPQLRAWIDSESLLLEPKQAWTDVARLTALGIPAVNFGPGETALAHQARESVSIAALEAAHRLLRKLFL